MLILNKLRNCPHHLRSKETFINKQKIGWQSLWKCLHLINQITILRLILKNHTLNHMQNAVNVYCYVISLWNKILKVLPSLFYASAQLFTTSPIKPLEISRIQLTLATITITSHLAMQGIIIKVKKKLV